MARKGAAREPSKVENLARAISSDDPTDWDRMGEAQRDYWRRIATRALVYVHRLEKAKAEMAAFVGEQAA